MKKIVNLTKDGKAELEKELKSDAQMFKQFDFMQMMTKLQYGNLKSSEREELINKMSKIAKEI